MYFYALNEKPAHNFIYYLFIYLLIERDLNVDKSSSSTTRFAKTLTVACLKHKTIN